MSQREERKTTTDVLFEKTDCNMERNIRTQEIDKMASSWEMVEECLLEMFLKTSCADQQLGSHVF